jgi:hypothetical protein
MAGVFFSPFRLSGAYGAGPLEAGISQRKVLAQASACLHELADTLARPSAPEATELIERLRQQGADSTSGHAAAHQLALERLSMQTAPDTSWVERVQEAQESLAVELQQLRQASLDAVPFELARSLSDHARFFQLWEVNQRIEAALVPQMSPCEADETAWGPAGALRREGLAWLEGEANAEAKQAFWEQFCDQLQQAAPRLLFSTEAPERRKQYHQFGQQIRTLWQHARQSGVTEPSCFLVSEEFQEILAGTCHTGWVSHLGGIEHLLEIAGAPPLPKEKSAGLTHRALFAARDWRLGSMRDHLVHQVAQAFFLIDQSNGSIDAHVQPALEIALRDVFALGGPDRELHDEVWAEEFSHLLAPDGEPSDRIEEWFWTPSEKPESVQNLIARLQGLFAQSTPEAQGSVFEPLLEAYGEMVRAQPARALESPTLAYLDRCQKQLQVLVDQQNGEMTLAVLQQLAAQGFGARLPSPRFRTWSRLQGLLELDAPAAFGQLQRLQMRSPTQSARELCQQWRWQAAGEDWFEACMASQQIQQALLAWEQSEDPEILHTFWTQEVPDRAREVLACFGDWKVRAAQQTLRECWIQQSPEGERLTPFGAKCWLAWLGLLSIKPAEGSDGETRRISRWVMQRAENDPQTYSWLEQATQALHEKLAQDGMLLAQLPEDLREEEEMIAIALRANGLALSLCPHHVRDNDEAAKIAVSQNGLALQYASTRLKGVRSCVEAACTQNGLALQWAALHRQADAQLVKMACAQNGLALQFASSRLRGDPEVIEVAVAQNPAAAQWALDPHEMALAVVRQSRMALRDLAAPHRANLEVVLAAVTQFGASLQYASDALKSDRRVVEAAVRQYGAALAHASEALRDDLEIVRLACTQSPSAFEWASARLRADLPFALELARRSGAILRYVSDELKSSPELVLVAVAQRGQSLADASAALRDEEAIVRAAIRADPLALCYAGPVCRDHPEIVLDAVTRRGQVLQYASERLRDDFAIVITAVRSRASALRYASPRLQEDAMIQAAAEAQIMLRIPLEIIREEDE